MKEPGGTRMWCAGHEDGKHGDIQFGPLKSKYTVCETSKALLFHSSSLSPSPLPWLSNMGWGTKKKIGFRFLLQEDHDLQEVSVKT